ncbi:MAG: hypothetical protein ABL955_01275 [Elusimicrobiota bacterium]
MTCKTVAGGIESRKKFTKAETALPARSATEAVTVCVPCESAAVGVKLADEAVTTAEVVTSNPSRPRRTEAGSMPRPRSAYEAMSRTLIEAFFTASTLPAKSTLWKANRWLPGERVKVDRNTCSLEPSTAYRVLATPIPESVAENPMTSVEMMIVVMDASGAPLIRRVVCGGVMSRVNRA